VDKRVCIAPLRSDDAEQGERPALLPHLIMAKLDTRNIASMEHLM
jgi:hypothetical protein